MNRDKQMDIVRGIGILLVIYGHLFVIGRWLAYSFHIPMFFWAAGYMTKINVSFDEYFLKKVRGYYIPFVGVELLLLFLHNPFAQLMGFEIYNIEQIQEKIMKILCFQNAVARGGQLWFLFALFIISIIFYIQKKTMSNSTIIISYFIMFVLHEEYFKNGSYLGLESCAIIEIVLMCLPFYGAGYYCKFKRDKVNEIINGKIALVCVGVIIMCHYIFGQSFDIRTNYFTNTYVAVLTSGCGIVLCLWIGKKLSTTDKILSFCGRYSIYIMMFSASFYKMVARMFEIFEIYIDNLGLAIIQISVSVPLALGVGIFIEKIKRIISE